MSQPSRHGSNTPKKRGATPAGQRAAPRLDAANLAGVTTLMNPQHVKTGVNLEEAEKSVMGKNVGGARKSDIDPVRLYTSELNQLAEELGIDLLDDADPVEKAQTPQAPALGGARSPPRAGAASRGTLAAPTQRGSGAKAGRGPVRGRIDELIDDLDLGKSGGEGDSDGGSGSGSGSDSDEDGGDDGGEDSGGDSGDDSGEDEECDCDDDCTDECECACHEEEECDCDENCAEDCECACHEEEEEEDAGGDDDEKVDDIISRLESDLGIKTDGKRERRRNRLRETAVPSVERRRGGERVTNEQERRRHINSVVADLRGETRTTYGVERERIQDIKASKLEQIGQLRMTLEEEGIDCSSVTTPTSDSPMEEIDSVLNILRLKNDRNRYSSLAEEVILGVAEGIETVFDGTRTVPLVGWRPDYTGYHNTVNVKLHRMRFETSQVVGNIIEKYNIGPTARIVMELLPSFFLYPRQQKKQRGTPGLAGDPHVSDARGAYSAIREADDRKTLDDVRRL